MVNLAYCKSFRSSCKKVVTWICGKFPSLEVYHRISDNLIKGTPMLESGSAFGKETLTIRFGRKYPAAHPNFG